MNPKYQSMKSVSLLLILIFIVTSCHVSSADQEISSLNKKLDILTMVIYQEQLYVGSTMGLFRLNDEEELEEVELDYRIGFIYALFEVDQGLLIGGMNGLILLGKDGSEVELSELLPDKRVYSINKDLNGDIYIGTYNGLQVLDDELNPEEHSIELLSEMVNAIDFDFHSNKIIASYNVRAGGLTIVEGESSRFFDADSELSTINTTCIEMLEDSFFVGGGMYETGGFDKFVLTEQGYKLIKSYNHKDGLAGPKVRSMLVYKDKLLVGSEYDGFSVLNYDNDFLDIESYDIYTDKNGLSHNEIKCMVEFNGFIYFGTKAGLSKMDVSKL